MNPPNGATFYPIFSTRGGSGECLWQVGGANIPGTKNTFGGTSTAEYGPLLLIDLRRGELRRVHQPLQQLPADLAQQSLPGWAREVIDT